MSAFGPKQTSLVATHMSAFGGKADMTLASHGVLRWSRLLKMAPRQYRFIRHETGATGPTLMSDIPRLVRTGSIPRYETSGRALAADCAYAIRFHFLCLRVHDYS